MKTRQAKFSNGMVPGYHAKIETHAYFKLFIWYLFRRYVLNEDYFRVSRRFTGPRPRGTSSYSTVKANATAYRYYITSRAPRVMGWHSP